MRTPRYTVPTLIVVLALFGAAGIRFPELARRPAPAPEPDAPLALVLNLPAFRLDVYDEGERVRSYVVSIGGRGFETPVGEYRLSRAVWNPWWHPPNSAWAKNEKPTPPGPNNPMGRVKLFFHGLYYIHGSPLEGTIGEAASHGCIRLRNADVLELARLVHRHATPDLPDEALDALEARPDRTRTIQLERPVPLAVRYDLAEVRDGHLLLYPDVYARAREPKREAALRALRQAGYDPTEADAAWLDAVVRRSEREPVVVRSTELLAAGVVAPVPTAASTDG